MHENMFKNVITKIEKLVKYGIINYILCLFQSMKYRFFIMSRV